MAQRVAELSVLIGPRAALVQDDSRRIGARKTRFPFRPSDALKWIRRGSTAGPAFRLSEAMLILRSLLFNIAFYVNLVFWMIVLLPALVLPRRIFIAERSCGPGRPCG